MHTDRTRLAGGATDGRESATAHRQALRVALLVLVLASGFVGARLAAHDGDPTAFVVAGDSMTRPAEAPELVVREDDAGYDGQFFHRLARNPFTRDAREFGTRLDRPAYRHQRIGYPLVTWAVSGGGRQALVPWALIAVNLAALVALAYLAARLAFDAGRPAWWALLVAGWPGLLVALSYDLSEVLAATLLVAAVLALRRERWVAGTVLLTAAALTRETTLVLAVAVVAVAIVARVPRARRLPLIDRLLGDGTPAPVFVGLVPLAIAAGYRLLLTMWWSGVASTGPEIPSFVGVPGLALLRQLARWTTSGDVVGYYQLFQLVLVLAVLAVLGRALLDRTNGRPHERVALVGALLVLSMVPVWDRSVVFLRWPDEAVILGFAVALGSSRLPIRPLLRGVGALAATTALVWVVI